MEIENDELVKTKDPIDGVEVPKKKKKKKKKAPAVEEGIEEPDQEVPVKAKKKHAPKVESADQVNFTEEPIEKKKKKKKKPKAPEEPTEVEDDFQMVEVPTIEPFESPLKKKSKRSKKIAANSFDELEIIRPDDTYSRQSG